MGRAQKNPTKSLSLSQAAADAPKVWAKRFYPQPGRAEAAHLHQFFELLYVESGRGTHQVDGETFEVAEGDLFWMRPGQHHDPGGLASTQKWIVAFNVDAAAPTQHDGQFFTGALTLALSPFAPSTSAARRAQVPTLERSRWVGRFEAIVRELEEKPLGYGEAACAHLRLALIDLARLAATRAPEASPGRPLLAEVFAFIEARFRAPIGLRDVAEAVGRSPAYLTDLVRRETGRTVLQWVIDRRLSEARRLLLQSESPVSAIAESVGYLDAKHFAAQFRRATGASPHVWRSSRLGGAAVKKAVAT